MSEYYGMWKRQATSENEDENTSDINVDSLKLGALLLTTSWVTTAQKPQKQDEWRGWQGKYTECRHAVSGHEGLDAGGRILRSLEQASLGQR